MIGSTTIGSSATKSSQNAASLAGSAGPAISAAAGRHQLASTMFEQLIGLHALEFTKQDPIASQPTPALKAESEPSASTPRTTPKARSAGHSERVEHDASPRGAASRGGPGEPEGREAGPDELDGPAAADGAAPAPAASLQEPTHPGSLAGRRARRARDPQAGGGERSIERSAGTGTRQPGGVASHEMIGRGALGQTAASASASGALTLDGEPADLAIDVDAEVAAMRATADDGVEPAPEAALTSSAAGGREAGPAQHAPGAGAVVVAPQSFRLVAQPNGELGMDWSIGGASSRGGAAVAKAGRDAALLTRSNADAVVAAASRGISSALMQRDGTITIRLIPETLGALRLQVRVADGKVSVTMEASTREAADLLHANAASLRQSLESRGLQVERIHVMVQGAEAPRPAVATDPRQANAEPEPDDHRRASQDEHNGQHDAQHEQESASGHARRRATRWPGLDDSAMRFGQRLDDTLGRAMPG
jgi:hypothetical protein